MHMFRRKLWNLSKFKCFSSCYRIIAVGYEARACGVTRQMRGDDARKKCPEIKLVQVPEVRGKAELTK